MSGEVRRAVIRRIAQTRRVSLGVAAHIYSMWPIDRKRRATDGVVARRVALARAALAREADHG